MNKSEDIEIIKESDIIIKGKLFSVIVTPFFLTTEEVEHMYDEEIKRLHEEQTILQFTKATEDEVEEAREAGDLIVLKAPE